DLMREQGWQDDTRFAISLARSRAGGGYGPLRIRQELEMHQLEPGAVDAAFEALAEEGEDDWPGRARALVQRRYGSLEDADRTRRHNAAEHRLRRGLGVEAARRATGLMPDDCAARANRAGRGCGTAPRGPLPVTLAGSCPATGLS